MKMIDVYMKMTNFEIKIGTKLVIDGYAFDYVKRWLSETSLSYRFEYGKGKTLEDYYDIDLNFLNKEVEMIEPKEKKYLIAVHIKGLTNEATFLNYQPLLNKLSLGGAGQTYFTTTFFTKAELQSIQPVREFLEDMQGKYELIEVDKDESMDS